MQSAATCPPIYLFDADGAKKTRVRFVPERSDTMKKALVCATCKAGITFEEARIEMNGGHEHRFFNPHGIVYHIGCFGFAPGCRATSPASSEFSWFRGYQWQIACCHRCQTHVGWSFLNQGAIAFYGLILNRLAEAREN